MKLNTLRKEWVLEGLDTSNKLEADFFKLNELKIDPLHSYNYREIQLPQYTKSYQFEDRCGNTIAAVYMESLGEFKTGYRVEGVDYLIFEPERLNNVEELIKPCPDERKIGTIYKILTQEILPKYILDKKPSKLLFNPVSESRKRLADIILNRIIKDNPHLIKKSEYLINK
jgi:hypothetical protein